MTLEDLLAISQGYRDAVPTILTQTSSEIVEEEMLKREEFRNLILEQDSNLANQIDALRRARRDLALSDDYHATDIKKLKSRFWALRNAEKELKYRSPNV